MCKVAPKNWFFLSILTLGLKNLFSDHFQTLTKLNRPGNKHIICHHVIYELLRHTDMNRRAKRAFNDKIVQIMSVLSAYNINILKNSQNRKYNFFLDDFNLQAPKWVSLNKKITPTVFSRSNFNPLSEEDYFWQD